MKNRSIWSIVSCMVILSFLLASCAPTPTATPTTTAPTTAPATTAPTTTTSTTAPGTAEDKPKYGGTLTLPTLNDTMGFDQTYLTVQWSTNYAQHFGNDQLMVFDWTLGPAGSNKTDLGAGGWAPEGIFRQTGMLATSWQVTDDQTIIYKIRQGVHFHDKPPVNGRALVADDVVFSIKYMYLNPKNPTSYNIVTAPGGKRLTDVYVDPNDQWTVIVKVEDLAWAFFEDLAVKGVNIVPHEVVEKYGDLKDWHNAIGTSAFMLTDYVPGSAFTFIRNPNYWMKNPIGPGTGDQLPYVDGIKVLVIKDKSTAMAAFRTGKIDVIGERDYTLIYEDYQGILKTNPETKVKKILGDAVGMQIRLSSTDPLAKPLLSQRVRWALNMAIDRQAMIRDLYNGEATFHTHFFPSNSSYFTPPEKMPEILENVFGIKPDEAIMAKKMFEYHPDEAKKILAEEGYPNGFKTIVITDPPHVDLLSVIKDYWSKINVDLTLDVRDFPVYRNTIDAHKTQAMLYYSIAGPIGTTVTKWVFYGPGDPALPFTVSNRMELSDPILDDYIRRTNALYGKDLPQQYSLLQEADVWITWMAPWITTPGPHQYSLWQPWLKNYYGNIYLHPAKQVTHYYLWIDQELKKSMGH